MRYVQINEYYDGSTGRIMRGIDAERKAAGDETWMFWGRHGSTVSDHAQCFATGAEIYMHAFMTRLTDRAGFYSKGDTRRLLGKLDEIRPDIVHLHNIHGYYLNIEMLFAWLAAHAEVQVRWTLHDCWAFTGHCAYFTYAKCTQWQSWCASSEKCSQLDAYPKTICPVNCKRNFSDKRRIFTSVSPERMTLITPSQWLASLVSQSFLGAYPVEVRHNTIDKTVFKPTPSDFREEKGVGDRFMVLGVASPWTERKGLRDFLHLAEILDLNRFAIVLVGLSQKQIQTLPDGIIGLARTDSPQMLAGIYSAADVFFNPTREDNYPTVNLEAEACGTPVITYNTGGCSETIACDKSHLVEDFSEALMAITNEASL